MRREVINKPKRIRHGQKGHARSCGFHCIKMDRISVTIGKDEILRDVHIHVHCGNLTAVIGRNGAGKSTLLKAILGEVPHEGEIVFTDLREVPVLQKAREDGMEQEGETVQEERVRSRRKMRIGYVPQSLHIDKNTPTSVYDLIAGYVTRVPVFLHSSRKVRERIEQQLAVFQAEELMDKAVCDLSGGELQRVLLALATLPTPDLLVLDEPAAGIDQKGMQMFYETLKRIKEEYDMAIILVSHDLDYVKQYADQVVLLDRTVLTQGPAKMVFASEEYAAVFGAGGRSE